MAFQSLLHSVEVQKIQLTKYMLAKMSRHGKRKAMIDETRRKSITHEELVTSIQRFSSGLRKAGVAKNDIVIVHICNCVEFPVIYLGIIGVGAVPLLVRPYQSVGDVEHMANLAKAKFAITDGDEFFKVVSKVAELCPSMQDIFVLGDVKGYKSYESLLIEAQSEQEINFKDDAFDPENDMASIFFTSGTTGKPKGVMHTHYSLVAGLQILSNPDTNFFKDGEDVFMVPLTNMSHGGMIWTILALSQGATVIVTRVGAPPSVTVPMLDKYKVTVVASTSAISFNICQYMKENTSHSPSTIRVWCNNGMVSSPSLPLSLKQLLNVKHFVNLYGTTEANGISCTTQEEYVSGSVGHIYSCNLLKVVSLDSGNLLAVNQSGEICIKSPSVMKGYYKNEQATQQMYFKDHPGFYRTGDIGYIDEKGSLFIIDRIKDIVKVKGSDVSTSLLDMQLLDHPAVLEAAVVAFVAEGQDDLVYAAVVRKAGSQVSEDEICQYVGGITSPAVHLSGVYFVDRLPRNVTSKLLKDDIKRMIQQKMGH